MKISDAIKISTDLELINLSDRIKNSNLNRELIFNEFIFEKSKIKNKYYCGISSWIELLESLSIEVSSRLRTSNLMRCKCD